jgi:hypothetical protein
MQKFRSFFLCSPSDMELIGKPSANSIEARLPHKDGRLQFVEHNVGSDQYEEQKRHEQRSVTTSEIRPQNLRYTY